MSKSNWFDNPDFQAYWKTHPSLTMAAAAKKFSAKKPDLRPYHWHENNTECTEWFERDRAMVRLTDKFGAEIICLWDDAVYEFVEDGFKTRRQSWHEALAEYATNHKLRAEKAAV